MKIYDPYYVTVASNFFTLRDELIAGIPPQYAEYLKYIPIFIVMFIVTFLLTPLIGQIAIKYGLLDNPPSLRKSKWNKDDDPTRHIHKEPIPSIGAFAVILPMLVLIPIVLRFDGAIPFIYVGMLVLIISSFLDSKYNLPAKWQLIFQTVAATLLAISIADISFIKIPFDGILNLQWVEWDNNLLGLDLSFVFPGDLILILWVVGAINAIKWVGGVDSLLEGNLILAFILLYILGIRTGDLVVILVTLMLIGGLSGFIFYNFPPAKIFSGSGRTIYGFLAAALAVLNSTKLAATVLIFLLPIIDALIVVTVRYFKYRPKNIVSVLKYNDKTHLHHQLLEMGFKPLQILVIEGAITLLVGSIAIFTTDAYRLFVIVACAFAITAFISTIWIINLRRRINCVVETKDETPEDKYRY